MLVWIDLETTGLDARKDRILEVACIVTDDELNELGRWCEVVRPYGWEVGFEKDVLEPVVYEMHRASGLLDAVAASHHRIRDTDDVLSNWIAAFVHNRNGGQAPQLAGSTVDFDRLFLREHMPQTLARLHYRNVDVTTLNEMARRFWPRMHEARPRSGKAHRALADIEESLKVARYYSRAIDAKIEPSSSWLDRRAAR